MLKAAIMYDFDLTLSTKNMQEYSLLPALNVDADQFWGDVTEFSKKNNMDSVLAYMYKLIEYGKKNNVKLTRDFFHQFGKDIQFYPGVEEYFSRINKYAASKGILLQHYIISSGTMEIIEATSIYPYFTKVFACQYHYDENGEAIWPNLAINYTGKTQFLFRINKNSLDICDNSKINAKNVARDIPFNHMIYIADGMTDVPCMVLVKNNGGYSIAVHDQNKNTHRQLLKDGRVNYVALADYRQGSELSNIIESIIDKIAIEEKLNQYSQ